MAWGAKPSGSYTSSDQEYQDNILEINGFLNDAGYTLESQAGVIANIYAESGLNPWRWQGDVYNTSGGYGLFQYTPGSGYLNLSVENIPGFGPSQDVNAVDPNARPEDGWAQLVVMNEDKLGKWYGACWRTGQIYQQYWDANLYPQIYADVQTILSTYGNGNSITLAQYKAIDNIDYAVLAFMGCFEGPLDPFSDPTNAASYDKRKDYASSIYALLSGDTPPDPPSPTPGTGRTHTMPFYLYFI